MKEYPRIFGTPFVVALDVFQRGQRPGSHSRNAVLGKQEVIRDVDCGVEQVPLLVQKRHDVPKLLVAFNGNVSADKRKTLKPAPLTRVREEVQTGVDTRRATEGLGGRLDSLSRSPTEHNAVDMPGSAAAVESW
jgi:hypothetical protein